jgi:hypothetical protein
LSANRSFVTLCDTSVITALLPCPLTLSWLKGSKSRCARLICWTGVIVSHVESLGLAVARHICVGNNVHNTKYYMWVLTF